MNSATSETLDRIAHGEGQAVEFKSQYPAQARDLAKEIAAFATSNDGVLFLGVGDDGAVIGLPDAKTSAQRDVWQRRIQGICGSIKPPVMPRLEFAVLEGMDVICIHIPKGSAPLYYVQHVPYVRHLSSSRPAEPQEVIDLVLAWSSKGGAEPSPEEEFLSVLTTTLINIMVRTSEVREKDRNVKPWFYELRSSLENYAATVRNYSLHVPDDFQGLGEKLETLAELLDSAAHEDIGLNFGWKEYAEFADGAGALAREIKTEWIDRFPVSEESLAGLERAAESQVRALASLAKRAPALVDGGRRKELQAEAAGCGWILLNATAFGVGFGGPERRAEIEMQARRLRSVETRTVYMDGGKSIAAIVEEITAASANLSALFAPEGSPT